MGEKGRRDAVALESAPLDNERLELIRDIELKRGSRVIAYVTGDREGLSSHVEWEDVRAIERHVRLVMRSNPRKLDLLLATNGGVAVMPWRLVSMLREFLGDRPFSVLIPSRAMSAGTKISLGADEIVMGPAGVLGPIDTQVGAQTSVEAVSAYFDLVERSGLKSALARLEAFRMLAASVPPIVLGLFNRVAQEGERVALRLLESRRKPLSAKSNEAIVSALLRQIGLHGQAISRSEARRLGLSFVKDAETYGIEEDMAQLFDQYEALLKTDAPFIRAPDPADPQQDSEFDLSGAAAAEQPVAIVESIDRLDIAKSVFDYRFWRDAPPQPAPTVPAPTGEEDPEDPNAPPRPYPNPAIPPIPVGGSAAFGGNESARPSGRLIWRAYRTRD